MWDAFVMHDTHEIGSEINYKNRQWNKAMHQIYIKVYVFSSWFNP